MENLASDEVEDTRPQLQYELIKEEDVTSKHILSGDSLDDICPVGYDVIFIAR